MKNKLINVIDKSGKKGPVIKNNGIGTNNRNTIFIKFFCVNYSFFIFLNI